MKVKPCFVTALVLAVLMQSTEAQYRCNNPNRNSGYCLSLYDCPSLFEVVNDFQLSTSQRQFLRASQCENGYGRSPYVCCTADKDYRDGIGGGDNTRATTPATRATTTPRSRITNPSPSNGNGNGNVLPEPPRCGPLSLSDKIYNGNDTALDEYPWMVLLGYVEKSGKRSLNCGGSLINQRYVLTAAHCVKGQIEQEIGPLEIVRLGEYDLTRDIDCIQDDCNNRVLEVGFEEVIPHPQFDSSNQNRHHDIALIRLSEDVTYSDFVQPVCLPLSKSRTNINAGDYLRVAGWGRTLLARQSDVKKHLAVPVNDHNSCANKFRTRNVNLITSQICAGGEYAKDSCDGDSGGPLMRQGTQKRWYLEGVVSFGNRCGLEGWPGVYTLVSDYIDWIQQNLRP